MTSKLPVQFQILVAVVETLYRDLEEDRAFWEKRNNAEDSNRPVLDQIDNQLCVLNHIAEAARKAFS